ncbi:MAG: hypothetical protein CXZ00_15925 [Acidobacteria bacterium]|nr:MAG: hypothetical protein CXZ00_15925 [Acidobacteriota bacterium]
MPYFDQFEPDDTQETLAEENHCVTCEGIQQQLLDIATRMRKFEPMGLLHISEVALNFDLSLEREKERESLTKVRDYLLREQVRHQQESHPQG